MSVRAVGRVAEQNASWSKKELDLLSQAIQDNIDAIKQAKKDGKSYFEPTYNYPDPKNKTIKMVCLVPVETVSAQKDCTYGRAEEIIREQIRLFSEKGGSKKQTDQYEVQLTEALNMKLQTSEEHKQKTSTLSRVLGSGLRRLTASSTTAAASLVGRASLSSKTFDPPETAATQNGAASSQLAAVSSAPPLPARRSVVTPPESSEAPVLSEDATELACLQAEYYIGAVKKNDPIRVDPLDTSHRLLSPKEKKGQLIPYEKGAVSVLNFFYSIKMDEDTPENLVEQITSATMNVASVAMEHVFQKKIGEFFSKFISSSKEQALHSDSLQKSEIERIEKELLTLFSDLSEFTFALYPFGKTRLVELVNLDEAIYTLVIKLVYVKRILITYHKLSSETVQEFNRLYSGFYGNADISKQIDEIKELMRQEFAKIEEQGPSLTDSIMNLGRKGHWSTKQIATLLKDLDYKIDQLTQHIYINCLNRFLTDIRARYWHRQINLLREEIVVRIKELRDKEENPYYEKLDLEERRILEKLEEVAKKGLSVTELRLRSPTILPESEEEEERKTAV